MLLYLFSKQLLASLLQTFKGQMHEMSANWKILMLFHIACVGKYTFFTSGIWVQARQKNV